MAKVRVAIAHAGIHDPSIITLSLLARHLERDLPEGKVEMISHYQILQGELRDYDVVIFPGGLSSILAPSIHGDKFIEIVQDFVAKGGGFVGSCGGAYAAAAEIASIESSLSTSFMKSLFRAGKRIFGEAVPSLKTMKLANVIAYWPNLFSWIKIAPLELLSLRSLPVPYRSANFEVAEQAHPIIHGHEKENLKITYSGGAILDKAGEGITPLVSYDTNAFMPEAYKKLAVVCTTYGNGRVVLSGPHPELPPIIRPPYLKASQKWLYVRMITWAVGSISAEVNKMDKKAIM